MKIDPRLLLLALLAAVLAAACSQAPGPGEAALKFEQAALENKALPGLDPENEWTVSLVETKTDGDSATAVVRLSAKPTAETIAKYKWTEAQAAQASTTREETLRLERERGSWRVSMDHACLSRAAALVGEAQRALDGGDKKTARAKGEQALALCPTRSEVARLFLADLGK